MLPRVPGNRADSDAGRQRGHQQNPLSALSQWKIFDNLRRSLVPAALTLLLMLGWTILSPAWFWTLVVIGIILIPPLIATILDLFRKPDDVLPGQHLAATLRSAGGHFAQALLTLACLPYEAYFSLDAIVRTNWRILVTQKQLLEWTPSGSPDRDDRTSLAACYQSMWIAPAISIASAVYLAASTPAMLAVAGSILFLWMGSPAIAWWISRPLARRKARLTADQLIFLQKNSRKTWAFFETFVGPEDHWLPPDNYQEHPVAGVAHRTSPTNMGLALLANLTAYDFGYIAIGPLIERTANALATMAGLTRHQGHFYNWYDTQSLQPLTPLYISSVDSGNLAGHLLTLRPGLLALPDHQILGPRLFDGLFDTLRVLVDAAAEAPPATLILLDQLRKDLESAYDCQPVTLAAAQTWLARLATSAAEAATSLDRASATAPESDAQWWAQALARQCRSALDELTLLAPWLALPAASGRLRNVLDTDGIPTLRELATIKVQWLAAIEQRLLPEATPEERKWLDESRRHVAAASRCAQERITAIERLALQAGELAAM
ncbi:MAG: cyclic beta 1-2 glucan synthetase, partial [Pseudomonadota bacterium]